MISRENGRKEGDRRGEMKRGTVGEPPVPAPGTCLAALWLSITRKQGLTEGHVV